MALLDPIEQRRVEKWNELLSRTVFIDFVATGDQRSEQFEAFAEEFGALASHVRFLKKEGGKDQLPSFTVDHRWTYRAIPTGGELPPFLEILSRPERWKKRLPAALVESLRASKWPADFKIYVTAQCPFCPHVVGQLSPLPATNPLVHVTVIDGALFSELAIQDNIRSVPTVLLDERFRWTGSIVLDEVLDALKHRDPLKLNTRDLKILIKDGDAAHVAKIMLENGILLPGFLDLLIDPEWSTRLGAMVVLEEIAEKNPLLASQAGRFLMEKLESTSHSVKGDLIYLLGVVGCRESVEKLRGLLEIEEDEETREVIIEAISRLS